jgi:hypothetical protein
MTINIWVALAVIIAWALVQLTRLTLAHRRAVQAATRKAAKETSP